jgi:ATP-dependent DNA helicase RecG
MAMTEVLASDSSGNIIIIWFNQPYLKNVIKTGMELLIYGKILIGRQGLTVTNPTFTILNSSNFNENLLSIEPNYSSVDKVTNKFFQNLTKYLIDNTNPLHYLFPSHIIEKYNFFEKRESFRQIHYPKSSQDVVKIENFNHIAQVSLIFEEFFIFFLGVYALKQKLNTIKKEKIAISNKDIKEYLSLLPFTLTNEQMRVLTAIYNSLKQGERLVRLVQGDVGSGKTVVALMSAMPFLKQGKQVAFLAPTEILANQHFQTINAILKPANISVALLTGSMKQKEKRKIIAGLENGMLPIVIGTHALIQDTVVFNKLEFVIIDEQHRFGVEQREALIKKGNFPHILSLTATPIPRTLAMTLYGHYDYDAIKSKPPGRKEVNTIVKKRENAYQVYDFVYKMAKTKKMQSYFVYPLIEESETLDLENATDSYKNLSSSVFKDLKTALVHGKMKPDEKDTIMNKFKNGEIDILFSTTVIEVGVDVANANIMVIENAERFGLSALHQLRGRIGRGETQGYCFLIVEKLKGENSYKRIMIMNKTNDGFKIAEKDLEIRGPGEFLGTKQSGLPDFKIADIMRDKETMELARKEAKEIIINGNYKLLNQNEWQQRFGKTLI